MLIAAFVYGLCVCWLAVEILNAPLIEDEPFIPPLTAWEHYQLTEFLGCDVPFERGDDVGAQNTDALSFAPSSSHAEGHNS